MKTSWRRILRGSCRLLGLGLAAALLLAGLQPGRQDYLQALRQADDWAAALQRTAAESAYVRAAALDSDSPAPYLRLARLYLDWGRAGDAAAALEQARRLDAPPLDVLPLQWQCAKARNDGASAESAVQQWLSAAPGEPAAQLALADLRLQSRAWDEAAHAYETALALNPDNRTAHEGLGALALADRPEEALVHLQAAGTALSQALVDAHTRATPTEDDAYLNATLGQTLIRFGRWALATRYLEQAVALRPGYAEAYAYLGYALTVQDEPGEGREHLLHATDLAPSSPLVLSLLALHHRDQGDLDAAQQAFETAYDLDPGNPALCLEIGLGYAAQQKYDTASLWLQEALRLAPAEAGIWRTAARYYAERAMLGERGEALAVARRAVELDSANAEGYDLLGWAYFLDGDLTAARAALQRAAQLDPTLDSVPYHLGRLEAASGDFGAARAAYTRTLDLDVDGSLSAAVSQALDHLPEP